MLHKITIRTKARVDFRDITEAVRDAVTRSGVQGGVCHVFIPHTTAAVTVNEHVDPHVLEDVAARLESLAPQQGSYRHSEGNAPAHVKASLLGSSQALLVEGGKLLLGTWQGVFFCEFDGPRDREIYIRVVSES
ncbi:MAG: YjbQ family protein [Chloroflexi bacterium]|nr:YjbQ family protein [Chloroflexota bacterium]